MHSDFPNAPHFLNKWTNFPHFIEREGSLPYLQQPAIVTDMLQSVNASHNSADICDLTIIDCNFNEEKENKAMTQWHPGHLSRNITNSIYNLPPRTLMPSEGFWLIICWLSVKHMVIYVLRTEPLRISGDLRMLEFFSIVRLLKLWYKKMALYFSRHFQTK